MLVCSWTLGSYTPESASVRKGRGRGGRPVTLQTCPEVPHFHTGLWHARLEIV